jgi:WD40 repeat protein
VTAIDFTPDGLSLITASDDKSIIYYKLDDINPILTIENAHDDQIKSAIYLDNSLSATGGYDKVVKIWDCKTKKVYIIYRQSLY